ncbi:MAG: GAF domain-containing protein, partial [Anaerolineae bacterium]
RIVTGIDVGLDGLAVRSISPIFHQNTFIGMLEVGQEYGQDFVQSLKVQTESDYKIWLSRRAATRVSFQPALDVPESPILELFYYAGSNPENLSIPADVYRRVLESGQSEIKYASDGQQELAILVAPLRAYQDEIIGILEIATPRTKISIDVLQSPSALLGMAGGLALGVLVLMLFSVNWIVTRPLGQLAEAAHLQLSGDLSARAELSTGDEFEQLGHTLNALTEKLGDTLQGLDDQIAQRTHDLERRSTYLEASTEVSRVVTAILEPDRLIQRAVDLIREHFDLYYVGLFLTEEDGEWAAFQAGTGAAGQAMRAQGRRVRVGEGIIGWSIAHSRTRVASRTASDALNQDTIELPDVRSEAAIPLRSRGQVLGALTMLSKEPGAFDSETIATLQHMTDHVATALDNARLFAESQSLLERTHQTYSRRTQDAWAELLRMRPGWGYVYDQLSLTPTEGDWPAAMRQAEQSGQTVQKESTSVQEDGAETPTLSIPIKVRDNIIGVLGFYKNEADASWTEEEVALLETLTFQMGLALDSAQLYRDTERSAAREQLIGEVTTQIRETLDVETVLRTAAREVRQALSLPEVVVRLSSHPTISETDGQDRQKATPHADEEKSA